MSAGRSYIKNRADARTNTVFFGDPYQSLEIHIDITFILSSGVVDKDFHAIDFREILEIPYVTLIMSICVTGN